MVLPPAVIIHGARDAQAALAPGLPVTLISPPGAVFYAGCLWWASLLSAADFTGPALLDCGDAPGRALEALRLGLTGIILTSPPALFDAVKHVANKNVVILRTAPAALDMADPVALRTLNGWLGG